MKTIKEFIKENQIRMTSEEIGERPDGLMDDMPHGSTHWKIILKYRSKQYTVYFSQGPAVGQEPDTPTVLSCLASDASIAVNYRDALDVYDEFGYEGYHGTEQARRVWEACQKTYRNMHRILGDALLDELMFEVEP